MSRPTRLLISCCVLLLLLLLYSGRVGVRSCGILDPPSVNKSAILARTVMDGTEDFNGE